MSDTQLARGRDAELPQDIPARGWWDIAWRVCKRLGVDNVALVAGGIAMYLLLSVFPGLTAVISLYGLIATSTDVAQQLQAFAGVLPPGVWDIFNTQLRTVLQHDQGSLTLAATFGIVVALWSARSAMSSLLTAMNIAYGEREKRNFFVQILLSLAFTAGAILGFLLMLLLGIAIPLALKLLGEGPAVQAIAAVLRLLLMWGLVVFGLAVLYRYGPSRERPRWIWVIWGSVIAATLWIIASALFAVYVQSFARYGSTYGALGGVVALLMWFYISSIIFVLGAEINAEMERQTRKDTTDLNGAPMGQRGAYAADTVGPSAGQEGSPSSSRKDPPITGK